MMNTFKPLSFTILLFAFSLCFAGPSFQKPCPENPGEGAACGTLGTPGACPEGEYCNLTNCGRTDEGGRCETKPEVCTRVYHPVCGCDGKTYGNACEAAAAGVSVEYEGECEASTTPNVCGGITGLSCPDGQVCVDDPKDDCNPKTGGADCSGICLPVRKY